MMKMVPRRRRQSCSEQGYILVWVMFLVAVFTIWLAVAIPNTAKEIQRDREVETMERGKQYIRAVQLYYRRFHAYPPTKDALVNTNQIRFLRKQYKDPMTGKDDWKPILFGQAKTQPLGFFGQPLAGAGSAGGSLMAGIGPSGNGGLGGSSSPGSMGPGSMGSGSIGSSSMGAGGSSIGGPGLGSSSIFSSSDNGSAQNGSTPGTASSSGTGVPGGSNGNSSDMSANGQTFGGAGIVGFSPASTKQSILIYKKKYHYNEWEFVYDPITDMRTVAGNRGQIGQPATGTTNQIGSPGFGSTSNSGSDSSSSGSGSSSPATPTSPQQ